MRGKVLVLLSLLLALPMMGFSQSTLNFPKLFTAAELPNSGFAIVNPGSSSASVTFTLYSAAGAVVATGSQSYGPGTQLARLGNQIFTGSLGSGGWVQATSTTTGLQGFWLNYDPTASIYLDGAATATAALNQAIPLIAGSTQINVANPNPTATTVLLDLRGNDGTAIGTQTETIAANGVFQADAFTLFNIAAPATPVFLRVRSQNTANLLAATALVKNYLVPSEDAVVNGYDEGSTATTLNIPHVVSGPLGGPNYTTQLAVVNITGTPQTVTATFYNCGNATFGTSQVSMPACTALTPVQIQLAAHGSLSDSAQHLFSLSPTAFYDGWIQLSGTLPIAGVAGYADLVGGAFTIVPATGQGSSNQMFAHIANLPPWNTGIALLNAGLTTAQVKVYAMTPGGTLIGGANTDSATATVSLAANAKVALGLSQLIPESGIQNAITHPSDGGFVYVTSTAPIYAIELFYNNNVSILSNVASGSLATGITYTPPATFPAALTLTSLTPTLVARGNPVTLSGTGFSTTAANDTVIFTTANGGTVSATATTSTSTSMTVTVPATAVTGPVTIQANGQTSSAVILEVTTTGNTGFIQSSATVSGGATTSGVDIYVDTQVGTGANLLNATQFGVGAVGSTSIALGMYSGTVAQGATMSVLVYGTGITQANGTTLAFSGSGITVTGVQYGTLSGGTYLTATITVTAGATVGPRNAILTNSNGDVSVLSGALIISQD